MAGLRTHLPFERTVFIGREHELSLARELLGRSRLLTLTGVGGTGKTRLALELASELEAEFEAGAALVELAALTDAALVGQAVVQALGLGENARQGAQETLVDAIGELDLLLLLDNCEHVLPECAALIDTLLKRSLRLRVLATSRQPLEITGEAVFSVPPMSLPPVAQSEPEVVGTSEAVRLFADRAALARPGFALVPANAGAVAAICRMLDGLPLAIELAAARARAMSPDEIVQRLDDRFSLLESAGAADPRHQTLRATIDWSHGLLNREERLLFRRLSVFAGGWGLEDAAAVCADEQLPHDRVVAVHTRLVDRSLVLAEPGLAGPTRHRMLETVREFAGQQLREVEESVAVRRRHFEHFLAVAEEYYARRTAGGPDTGLVGLAAHRDNFRAALAWSIATNAEDTLRLTAALEDVWRMIGPGEGWRWLERTLPLVPTGSRHRGRALLTAGMLSAYVPAYAEGMRLLTEAQDLARSSGDRTTQAWAQLWLGRLAFFEDDVNRAQQHLDRSLELHTTLGNVLGEVRALALIGLVRGLAEGQVGEAIELLRRAVGLADESADGWGKGYARLMLGLVLAEAGQQPSAAEEFRAALGAGELGPILGVPLQGLARCLVEVDAERAMRLLGAAAAHFDRTGTLQPGFVRRRADAAYDRCVQLLGAGAATRAFDEGRRMTADGAIELAQKERPPKQALPGGLTRRELQVASLVARGLANREVATMLFLSVRTVESHVDHVLTKLGLHNRTQLSAWARDNAAESVATFP